MKNQKFIIHLLFLNGRKKSQQTTIYQKKNLEQVEKHIDTDKTAIAPISLLAKLE